LILKNIGQIPGVKKKIDLRAVTGCAKIFSAHLKYCFAMCFLKCQIFACANEFSLRSRRYCFLKAPGVSITVYISEKEKRK